MTGNPLDDFTSQALGQFGTQATQEMYRRLREDRQLCATRCTACGAGAFPPREHCPDCFGAEVEWMPIEEGTLYAFTTQARGVRFTAPEVVGVVEVEGVGLMFAPIAGTLA
ncbi:MAG: zinc ribbon domain-containing protein, partial [Myxococcota bacterium]|nr:zinc ribbon domain-containing protein [Myxococcota bacterium]